MIASRCTKADLEKALIIVNKKYAGNIIFRDINPVGKRIRFTLRLVSSKAPGHRLGFPDLDWRTGEQRRKQRRLASACWHVHGDFFDALLSVNPDAVIHSGTRIYPDARSIRIDKNGGNWQDWNAGSKMFPQYMSELCECESSQ